MSTDSSRKKSWVEEALAEDAQQGEESYEAEQKEKARKDREFAQMLEGSFSSMSKKLSVGDALQAEILVIGKEEVFVATGTQRDGIVARRDLLDAEGQFPYSVGEKIKLFVTQVKGDEVRLSPHPTAKNLADDLEDAKDMELPVEGRVVEVCKGGFRVQVLGKLAFCPISQMDIQRIEVPEEYVGRRYEFRITQISERGRNIVVSRRKVLEQERDLSEGSFLAEHKAGEVVSGKIKRLEKFGAFVELAPGLEGLAHISELAWSRVGDPSEVVSVGQDVSVKILKIENEAGGKVRISLSIKQAGEQPWNSVSSEFQSGQVVPGKVTRCVKFGAFVELKPGVEGLIPLSEMSYTRRVVRSDELVKEGETVTVMIKEVNPETHRISLSLKDAGQDPWALAPVRFPVGTLIKGKIERREPYGLFIKLDEGVVGLLPKSKALEQPEFPFEKLKVGEETMVQVGELRLEERRISLQVPKDPGSEDWKNYVSAGPSASGSLGSLGGVFGAALQKAVKKK